MSLHLSHAGRDPGEALFSQLAFPLSSSANAPRFAEEIFYRVTFDPLNAPDIWGMDGWR